MALQNFYFGAVMVLITPVILGLADPPTLGAILSLGGVGFLVGSLLMTTWGGPQRRVAGVLALLFLQGGLVLVGAVWTSIPLIAAAVFGVCLLQPLLAGCDLAIWQRQVPLALQGRALGLRTALAAGGLALSYLGAGALSDHFFEPWMAADGPLASTVGRLLGTGRGRGSRAQEGDATGSGRWRL